jgi:hypothetical protein
MVKRSIPAMIVLTIITFGIYHLYWMVATKEDMLREGADIPTAWLLIIPIANLYWMWKWGEGVEHVTRGKMTAAVAFLLLWLLGAFIGPAILQATFNRVLDDRERGNLPRARIAL